MPKSKAQQLGESGERMVPDVHKNTLMYAEHLSRYMAAKNLVEGKVVLDIASGSGYGTKILSEKAAKVFGVDVDKESVAYAQQHYAAKNVAFLQGDGESIPLETDSIDVAITFETIEHIKNYTKFIEELSRVVKPDGLIIVSTPNDLEFAEGNHYHLHEFEEKELKTLLSKYYKNIDSYYQATWKYVALGSREQVLDAGKASYSIENYSQTKPKECLYFYMLCSNRNITEKIEPMGIIAEHYSDRYLIGKDMVAEKNIADYKQVVKDLKKEYTVAIEDRDRLYSELADAQKWIDAVKTSFVYRLYMKTSGLKLKR